PWPLLVRALPSSPTRRSSDLLGLYVVVNTLIGSIIEPRFMGQTLGLSPVVVLISLMVWGWVFGPVGMLLSILLTMILKLALESSPQTRWLGIMLSDGVRRKSFYS